MKTVIPIAAAAAMLGFCLLPAAHAAPSAAHPKMVSAMPLARSRPATMAQVWPIQRLMGVVPGRTWSFLI
jgi:hypothetical protein